MAKGHREVQLELLSFAVGSCAPTLPRHRLAPALTIVRDQPTSVAFRKDCSARLSVRSRGRGGTLCVVLYLFGRGRRIWLDWLYSRYREGPRTDLSNVEQMLADRW